MIQGKIAYVGLAVALGYGLQACSSSDTPANPATETGGSSNGGSSTGGSSTGGKASGGTTSTGGSATGGTAGAGGGGAAGTPSITITSPADNATVNASAASPDVDFSIDVKNFTLMPPTTCPATDTACGHLHILVDADVGDGKQCNTVGAPYNEAFPVAGEDAKAGPHAGLDYCKTPIPGTHLLTVELHHDNHSPVNGADGKVISDSIHFNVPGGDAGGGGDGGPTDAGNNG